MTKLYISSDTWDIYTDKTNHFSGFNEYGMKYDKIISSSISNKISDSNIYFENIGFTQNNYLEIKDELKININDLVKFNNQWYNKY